MKQDVIKALKIIGMFVLVLVLTVTAVMTFHNLHHYLQQRRFQELQEMQNDSNIEEIELLKQEIETLKDEKVELNEQIENIYITIEREIEKHSQISNILMFSDEDIEMLAKLVKCEAGNDTFESKATVCVVVINRINSNRFKNTLSEVIYQEGQFSPVENGTFETAKPTDDCYFAVEYALSLTYTELEQFYGTDLLFFRASTEEKVWGKNKEYAFTKGKTDFYRLK